jgi:hypothetical protein
MNKYEKLTAAELREMYLNNTLDTDSMSIEDYEKLFEHEMDTYDEYTMNSDILLFCSNGLNQFEKYQRFSNYKPPIEELFKRHYCERRQVRTQIILKISKWAAVFVVGVALSTQIVAMAFGYSNVIELIRSALNNPEKTVTDFNNKDIIHTNDTRFYNSMSEMLETENLDILYPTKLPNGYEFVNFDVTDMGAYFELRAYATEPYISFSVEFNVDFQIDRYDYEISCIEYNIVETANGMYKAEWVDGTNYYGIIVSDKATLSEIIKNLIKE